MPKNKFEFQERILALFGYDLRVKDMEDIHLLG
jgi:hypothetical protein